MIVRPDNLVVEKIALSFNRRIFSSLEIDLDHVNKERRSSFSSTEVKTMVAHFLDGASLAQSGFKEFADESCSYFVKKGLFQGKEYKLVVCVCSDRPDTVGVLTLHRT